MKVLHTSDWHLGRALYGKKRYAEFEAFLDWLAKTIEDEQVDILLVAGDVFDTSTPSNRAQELYYQFLYQVSHSCCRHVVIIAGNHDSPTFLTAPKALLKALNVYVVGAITNNLSDEVIVLNNNNQPEAIVCAVPYLRDRDIRTMAAGEGIDDKNLKLIEGLKNHYADVCSIAEDKQRHFSKNGYPNVPIIAMGHLFAAGGQTIDGDGVRELYVGSLAHVGKDIFPTSIDYLALGHLHVPQVVGGMEHIRYSGSPIAMGYGEAKQNKQVVLVDFIGQKINITTVAVPRFQELVRITGTLDEICESIRELKANRSQAWLEIEYTGLDIVSHLRDSLEEAVVDSELEILRIKNKRLMERVTKTFEDDDILNDLNPHDVFLRCLDTYEVPDAQRPILLESYNQIIKSIQENDINAE